MLLSIVCPLYNESDYIVKLIEDLMKMEPVDKEVFFIDGNSTDGTRQLILNFAEIYPNIRLIDNPNKYVPFALNEAIPMCKGKYIIRLDAHTEYSKDYLLKIAETFKDVDAEIVGGPMRAVFKNLKQEAISYATSSTFGVGNGDFHNSNYRGYTDSVYLGAWERSIFDKTGLFDTELIRNQDDEFHYRAKSLGYKIYLNPDIKSYYYPRDSFKKLFSQYFQYGLYKPLVIKKVNSEIKIRHFIPALFVLYLVVGSILSFKWLIFFIPLLLYFFLVIFATIKMKNSYKLFIYLLMSFPILHISYGLGFIGGVKKLLR